jgi:glycosyltransferase involved in cell wall biosynthesis
LPAPIQDTQGSRRDAATKPHLKVSVCMAIFNGVRFLTKQLDSILGQLSDRDELVIVSDGSTDRTHEIIEKRADPRIRLIKQACNQGVVVAFENAVHNATGDIIFFSDCDDIWAPDRVAKTREAFLEHEDASVVIANITLIDEDDNSIEKDDRLTRHPFDTRFLSNLVANRFQGSAMAVRSQLLPEVLPFPKKKLFIHDAWIGAVCALKGRKTVYLSEPLLYYRRHGANDSGNMSPFQRIKKRLQLLGALLSYPFRHTSQ